MQEVTKGLSWASPQAHSALLWTSAAACGLLAGMPAVALLAGIAFALTLGNPQVALTAKVQKILLQASVVGLGFGIKMDVVLRAGSTGLGATALSLAFSVGLRRLLAKWLRLDGTTGQLISSGTAICGGSAIAVMGPVLGANARQMSIALITVFLLNAVALFLFPIIGTWAGMDATQFGMWAAMAIHDTSSVAGAAAHYGPAALAVAVAVKLARALWILPMAAGTALLMRRQSKNVIPWFVLGFLAASAATTFLPVVAEAAGFLSAAAKTGLAVTLFLIGAGLTRDALQNVGWRPLAHAVILWAVVSTVSFVAVRGLVRADAIVAARPGAQTESRGMP
jgi:uncharacterized integral membrane protein (TIGR00698 family)